MKKIYIAGKVTGEDYEKCYHKFAQAETAIVSLGDQPVNPMRINKKNEDWGRAMVNCLDALLGCEAVLLLPDWEQSGGAKLEHDFAKRIGLKIIHHEDTPLIRKDSCNHEYRDGSSAIINGCGIAFCQLCGWDDYTSLPSEKIEPVKCTHSKLRDVGHSDAYCVDCGAKVNKIRDIANTKGYRVELTNETVG